MAPLMRTAAAGSSRSELDLAFEGARRQSLSIDPSSSPPVEPETLALYDQFVGQLAK